MRIHVDVSESELAANCTLAFEDSTEYICCCLLLFTIFIRSFCDIRIAAALYPRRVRGVKSGRPYGITAQVTPHTHTPHLDRAACPPKYTAQVRFRLSLECDERGVRWNCTPLRKHTAHLTLTPHTSIFRSNTPHTSHPRRHTSTAHGLHGMGHIYARLNPWYLYICAMAHRRM